jgi:uncharacterized protein (TIGR00251 family)
MVEYTEREGALLFTVTVVPRASRSEIAGEYNGGLRVRLAAPPVDGAANEELVRTIARALGVPPRNVEIVKGHAAKVKRIRVVGADQSRLEGLGTIA